MSDTDESLVIVDNVHSTDDVSIFVEKDDDDDEPELVQEGLSVNPSSKGIAVDFKDIAMTPTEVQTNDPNNPNEPHAIQIVSIGTDVDPYAFVFDSNAVQSIFDQIPNRDTMEIAIVSVVGAFRTGKSFLLSWFIHYLRHLQKLQEQELEHAGTNTSSNDSNKKKWYEQLESIGNNGFEWKAGSDRNTTGIWMWSPPYVISSNKVVLLIDTQGMFDHETTMTLTTNIFGFSTLLSSYQIYNVDKRIQEDHLQQLALFSEYARLMTTISTSTDGDINDATKENLPVVDKSHQSSKKITPVVAVKPFQKIEFLVRDWQHFEDDDNDDTTSIKYETIANSMMTYLEKVLAERDAKDLQDTREQILFCFEDITCFGLCHPGIAVTKKRYTGTTYDIEPMFVQLIGQYCEHVFDAKNLPSKTIHGRTITADQFGVYVQAYAKIFTESLASSSSSATDGTATTIHKINFPAATTMLEATASANNTNATRLALTHYKTSMNRIAGTNVSNYTSNDELMMEHEQYVQKSLSIFDTMANFGSKKKIQMAREQVVQDIRTLYETYKTLNDSRNPLSGVEMYVIYILFYKIHLFIIGISNNFFLSL
jgi:atlastin